jgi:hypothetical protein
VGVLAKQRAPYIRNIASEREGQVVIQHFTERGVFGFDLGGLGLRHDDDTALLSGHDRVNENLAGRNAPFREREYGQRTIMIDEVTRCSPPPDFHPVVQAQASTHRLVDRSIVERALQKRHHRPKRTWLGRIHGEHLPGQCKLAGGGAFARMEILDDPRYELSRAVIVWADGCGVQRGNCGAALVGVPHEPGERFVPAGKEQQLQGGLESSDCC